jgi:hypothetical protein
MKPIPSASVLLGRIDDELNRVARLVDRLVMAVTDMTDEVERDATHELVGVIGPKLFAMKASLREARETLTSQQTETIQ